MAGPHRWIATTPSSWVAGSFDTNLLPASNEIVRFDGSAQGDCIGGLNQTAVDLDLLEVHPSYYGRIGVEGNPLIISADEVILQGRGTTHYQDGDGTTDLMIVDSDNLQQAVKLYSGTFTRVRLLKGRTVLGPLFSTVITDLEVGSRGQPDTDVRLDGLRSSLSTFTRFRMNAGYVTGIAGISSVGSGQYAMVSGGTWRCGGLFGNPLLLSGGLVIWDSLVSSAGATLLQVDPVHIMGGTLDARLGGPKQIDDLYLWPEAQFLYNDDTMTVATTRRMEP